MPRVLARSMLSAALVAGVASAAGGQSFTLVGIAPGGTGSRVNALSADGRIAAGGSAFHSFTWTAEGGRVDLGLTTPPTTSGAYAISGDGQTIAGEGFFNGREQAFRWSGPGTAQALGVLAGYAQSTAWGVSGDGAVVVGDSNSNSAILSRGFRWTPATGMQALPFTRPEHFTGRAFGVSRDGLTVIGYSAGFDTYDACRWTAAGGAEILPALAGSLPNSNAAHAVNATGDIIVGGSGDWATMWRDGQTIRLGAPEDPFRGFATAVSDDGSVVGARLNAGVGDLLAGVWTPTTGMIRLDDYLRSYGVIIPGNINLTDCTAVSADGLTFAGYTTGMTTQGFVATIPTPPGLAIGVLGLLTFGPRRRHANTP